MSTKTCSRIVKQLLLLLFIFSAQISVLYAAPASGQPIVVTQPDGSTVTIKMVGDEFFGYASTMANLPVVRKNDGFFYYASYSVNGVEVTDVIARDGTTKSIPLSVQPMTDAVAQALRAKSPLLSRRDNGLSNSPLTKAADPSLPSIYLTKPLVVLVNFRDIKCTIPNIKSVFNNFMNQKGFSPSGSVKDYYSENSMGQYTPNFDVHGPVELPNNREYYGGNAADGSIDVKAHEAFIDAATELVRQGVNLKDYDQNGDGVLDNLFIIFAGNPESEGAPASAMWPHMNDISSINKYIGGVKLGSYGCTSEYKGASGTSRAGIGTFTHEFAHVLGLKDMYDTDYAKNGLGKGLGSTSLMASGNHSNGGSTPPYLNAFERAKLGWAELKELGSGVNTLEPVSKSNEGYIIRSDVEGEFFVIESRDFTSSWDKHVDVFHPKGMIIYHVDMSQNMILGVTASKLWEKNMVNAVSIHECMRIMPSSGTLNFTDMNQTVFPGARKITKFNTSTTPAALSWAKKPIAHILSNIAVDNNAVVTFRALALADLRDVSGVVKSGGEPVAGAQVKLVPVAVSAANSGTKSSGNGLSVVDFHSQTKSSSDEYYATTNSNGEFEVSGVVPGNYVISIASYQYIPYVKEITVAAANLNIGSVELQKASVVLESAISQANPLFSGYIQLSSGNPFSGIKMRWTPSHIATARLAGKPIKALYWYNYLDGIAAKANLYFGDKLVFSTKIATKAGANMTPVLGDLIVPADKDMYVEFTFPEGTVGPLVLIDNGPAKTGYGDLIFGGSNYTTLTSLQMSFNMQIGFSTENLSQEADVPTVTINKLGQYSANILFGTTDASVEKWTVTVKGPNIDLADDVFPLVLTCNDLVPNSNYQVTVTPILVTGPGKTATTEFKTLPLTEKYPAIVITPDDGVKHLITVNNVQELPQRVELYVNNELIDTGLISAVRFNQGVNDVVVKIFYADGLVETIARKYSVK